MATSGTESLDEFETRKNQTSAGYRALLPIAVMSDQTMKVRIIAALLAAYQHRPTETVEFAKQLFTMDNANVPGPVLVLKLRLKEQDVRSSGFVGINNAAVVIWQAFKAFVQGKEITRLQPKYVNKDSFQYESSNIRKWIYKQ